MFGRRLVVLVGCIFLVFGCTGPSAGETQETVSNLLQAGFPADDIMVVDGMVYVGRDAHVSLAASREMLESGATTKEQYRTANLVSPTLTKICINGSTFTGVLSTALDLAIQNYDELPLTFAMARTPSSGCSFTINAVLQPGLVGGSAGFPSGGLPYSTINIGDGLAPYGVDVIEHVITHEIGHTIGFRHSDYYNRSISCGTGGNEGDAGVGAVHIPGTPTTAASGGSLMNSCFRSVETGEFTSSDITALMVLYTTKLGTWSSAENLASARRGHTATLLASGRVLVVGGSGRAAAATAELYDPGTGTWSPTGSLASARQGNTATLLASGKVLVVGGSGSAAAATAELYDPGTGTWSPTGGLVTTRGNHTATLLSSGKVLVVGSSGSATAATAELYDPATGTWSPTGGLATARGNHTATLLSSGKVLVVGGGVYSPTAELYDPVTGTWSPTGRLASGRSYHTATLLLSGKVLVVGGFNSNYLSGVELYDPATGTWSSTGALGIARDSHTATLLPSGNVLVTGGVSDGPILAWSEVYDPETGKWSRTGSLIKERTQHTATLLPSGKVLAAGGYTGDGNLASAELYELVP